MLENVWVNVGKRFLFCNGSLTLGSFSLIQTSTYSLSLSLSHFLVDIYLPFIITNLILRIILIFSTYTYLNLQFELQFSRLAS